MFIVTANLKPTPGLIILEDITVLKLIELSVLISSIYKTDEVNIEPILWFGSDMNRSSEAVSHVWLGGTPPLPP